MKILLHGGLDTYFDADEIEIPLTALKSKTVASLMMYLQTNYPSQTVFDEGKLKPGHLCIINETDYELYGEDDVLNEDDKVYFISTMHGG